MSQIDNILFSVTSIKKRHIENSERGRRENCGLFTQAIKLDRKDINHLAEGNHIYISSQQGTILITLENLRD